MSDPTENDTKEHVPLDATETPAWGIRVGFAPTILQHMLSGPEWAGFTIERGSHDRESVVTTCDRATFDRLKARFDRAD